MLPITTVLASILALLYVWLGLQVIKQRRKHQVLIGTGGSSELEWTIRAHANFSEYVPLALILFACAEYNQTNAWVLSIFALMLLGGRAIHAYAFIGPQKELKQRVYGMKLTFWTIIGLANWNIGYLIYKFLIV
jgi:uncharacterized membrane protein YecN with MAPEG domain